MTFLCENGMLMIQLMQIDYLKCIIQLVILSSFLFFPISNPKNLWNLLHFMMFPKSKNQKQKIKHFPIQYHSNNSQHHHLNRPLPSFRYMSSPQNPNRDSSLESCRVEVSSKSWLSSCYTSQNCRNATHGCKIWRIIF